MPANLWLGGVKRRLRYEIRRLWRNSAAGSWMFEGGRISARVSSSRKRVIEVPLSGTACTGSNCDRGLIPRAHASKWCNAIMSKGPSVSVPSELQTPPHHLRHLLLGGVDLLDDTGRQGTGRAGSRGSRATSFVTEISRNSTCLRGKVVAD